MKAGLKKTLDALRAYSSEPRLCAHAGRWLGRHRLRIHRLHPQRALFRPALHILVLKEALHVRIVRVL